MREIFSIKDLWKEIAIGIISTICVSVITKLLNLGSIYFFTFICILVIFFLLNVIRIIINDNLFARKIFKNPEKEILKECENANWINVFVMKGDLFTKQDRILHQLFEEKYAYKEIRFLLANPESPAIAKRAFEIFDRPAEHLRQETQISLDTLLALRINNPKLTVKTHYENSIIRFIYTENFMFFSFFLPGKYAINSPFYKVNSDSPLYIAYQKYFEDILNTKSTIPEEI